MTAPQLHPAIDTLVRRLRDIPQVRPVVLFGSRARGDAWDRSDIDLAVEAPEADPRLWDEIARIVDEAPTLLPIDLIRLDLAAESIVQDISREGLVLYDRERTPARP